MPSFSFLANKVCRVLLAEDRDVNIVYQRKGESLQICKCRRGQVRSIFIRKGDWLENSAVGFVLFCVNFCSSCSHCSITFELFRTV